MSAPIRLIYRLKCVTLTNLFLVPLKRIMANSNSATSDQGLHYLYKTNGYFSLC